MVVNPLRILFLSFYFDPDISAGSFRSTALAQALERAANHNIQIDVLTTKPNRYHSFPVKAPEIEHRGGISIYRFDLPCHRSGILDQSIAFWSFYKKTIRHAQTRDYDLVFATSSRLMTAFLGAVIAKKRKSLLYLDIRDLFVDTIKDILPRSFGCLAKPLFSLLERWTFRQASKINLVSQGFERYFSPKYPQIPCSYFTNGIDDIFLEKLASVKSCIAGKLPRLKILYAGNIGEGQGLHKIIPALAQKMADRIQFKIVGDGGRLEVLRKALSEAQVHNVELIQPVPRQQLLKLYCETDVLFLHLNDYAAFKNVLPSKIFEYAAVGKPIWAGIAGYAANFVKSEIENAVVFPPCLVEEAATVFDRLVLQYRQRSIFIEKYARKNIMEKMADDILSLIKKEKRG